MCVREKERDGVFNEVKDHIENLIKSNESYNLAWNNHKIPNGFFSCYLAFHLSDSPSLSIPLPFCMTSYVCVCWFLFVYLWPISITYFLFVFTFFCKQCNHPSFCWTKFRLITKSLFLTDLHNNFWSSILNLLLWNCMADAKRTRS